MEAEQEWIVSTIDSKIVSISLDYTIFSDIMKKIARMPAESVNEIRCSKMSTGEVFGLAAATDWDDMRLFGTDFQKMVWRQLFSLTHHDGTFERRPRLLSYSDFAERCGKRPGVRAVAHAIGQNPVAVIIPCHLIVPKETMDRIREVARQAEHSLFGTDGLILDPTLDFGEYRYGKEIKRKLITGC